MKKIWGLFGVIALFAGTGCGGDSAAPASTTTLTESQAETLATELADSIGSVIDGSGAVTTKLSARYAATINSDIDVSGSCEEGGTVAILGEASGEASTGVLDLAYDVDVSYDGCGVLTDDSEVLILDGEVAYSGNIDLAVSDSSLEGDISTNATGSIDVSGEGVTSGTCGVSIDVARTLTGTSVSSTATGTICGTTINITFVGTTDDEE